ncbi:MAG TPA: class I SAM-dependent methyltransferase [Arenimonas sp.]|uniref:class I SAM-dependent methyltransferase n=1 Tax=Arenimonas sp. TaxID=1872635 RepID=UPI002D80EAE2|nr:class I SAM-dependent methyltransferase [Arenimonas sp.]HEU0152472.1 class I SAM-dependent methyltransferase [Arenimonas sp.]
MNGGVDLADLRAQAERLCLDPVLREAVWRHAADLPPGVGPERLSLRIHPDDQMLAHSLAHHREANASFGQYFNVALQQYHAARQVMAGLFGADAGQAEVLDFACGFGRLLRFLSLVQPPSRLLAAEIQPEALAFVREAFGVAGVASPADPARFEPGRRFDFIWVASLFSHLPPALFEGWLRRLHGCLAPDGVLCFSVHDACLLPPAQAMPDSGCLFFPQSEIADLDTAVYGTTYVTEAFVAATIARTCGADHGYHRIPRGLAHEQDLYLVAAAPGRDYGALQAFRRGPWGWADERRRLPDGTLYLRGWAASLDEGALDAVEASVDGVAFDCCTGGLREDVAQVLGDARLAHSGWEFRHRPAPGEGPVRVVVSARSRRGERALVFAGHFARPPADGAA